MKCEIEEFTPRRATDGSAGYDFYSPVDVDIVPEEWTVIDTLVSFDGTEHPMIKMYQMTKEGIVPVCAYIDKWCMKIYPRSGLSFKTAFNIINTVPIIDMDYRDTIKLKVTSEVPISIKRGDRIAQGIFEPVLVLDDEIKPMGKRNGGFGSTGV